MSGTCPCPDRRVKIAPLDQPPEEFLSQVLGVFRTLAAVPREAVDRMPVRAAKILQRRVGARILRGARFEHNAPMRSRKLGQPRPGTGFLSRPSRMARSYRKRRGESRQIRSNDRTLHEERVVRLLLAHGRDRAMTRTDECLRRQRKDLIADLALSQIRE